MEPWLVASLVVDMNIQYISISKTRSVANVGSVFGCGYEYSIFNI